MPTTFIPDEPAIPKTFVPDGASGAPVSFVPDSEFSNVYLPQTALPPVVNAQAPLALPDVGPVPQQFGTTSNERSNAMPMSIGDTVQHVIGTGVAGVLNAFANVNAHRVGTDGQLINQPKPTFQLQFGKANPSPLEESVQPQQPPFEAGKYFGPAGLKLANEDIDPVNAALGGLLRSPFTPEGALETPALMAGGAPAKAVMGLFGAGAGENLAKQGVSRLVAVMDSSQPSDVRKQAAVSLVSDIAMLAGGLHGTKGEAAPEPSQQQYEQPLSQPRNVPNVQQPQSFVPDATPPLVPQELTPSPTSSPVQNNEPVALKNMPVPSNDVVPPTEPIAPTTAPVQGVAPASASFSPVVADPKDVSDIQHNLNGVLQTLKSNKGLGRLDTQQVQGFQAQGDSIFNDLVSDGDVAKAQQRIDVLQKDVTRKANQSNPSTPDDLTAYDSAQQQMKDAIQSGDAAALMKAFTANEQAKDKFGGMPPIERRQGYVPPTNAAESDGVSTAATSNEQAEGESSPATSQAVNNQTTNAQRPIVEPKASSTLQEEGVDKGTASATQSGNAGQRLGQQSRVADESTRSLNQDIVKALSKKRQGEAAFVRLVRPDFFDKLGFKKDASVDSQQLGNRIKNQLGEKSGTWDFLDKAGFGDWLKKNPKVTAGQAEKWVRENEPKVEVRKFSDVNQTPQQKEASVFIHEWYDSLPQKSQAIADSYVNNNTSLHADVAYKHLQNFAKEEGLTENQAKLKLDKWTQLRDIKQSAGTHWQSITPKSEQDTPGYTELAVVKPQKRVPYNGQKYSPDNPTFERGSLNKDNSVLEPAQFPSSHNFPPNTLGFVRGYMEHRADGGKTFHVIEVQSDWAQRVRDMNEAAKSSTSDENYMKGSRNKLQDPLLPHYERLALKAAIEHARAEGADRIAVSDAETAMMTEGHDRQGGEGRFAQTVEGQIPQAPGMRLHYDRTLPKIASELTGEQGKRVDFGEHKMALDTEGYHLDDWESEGKKPTKIRKDLIFRNPDSTPKTSVTAREYSLARAERSGDFTAFGSDKPQGEKSASSPVQLLNKTGSFNPESGALNGKIVQELVDKVRKGLTPSDLFREVFNKDSLNAVRRGFMGHDVPHTLGHGEPLADALVKAAGADTAGRLVGRSMVTDVLGNNAQDPQFRKQLGAALYEDQRKAYMRDNPSAQTTPVLDTKSSPFADEQQMQAFMKRQDVKDTIQRHVDTVQALAQEQHTKLGGKLAAVGKETGAFANLKAVLDDQEAEQQLSVGKGQMATIKKGSAFNKERGFTGSDYDFDYRNIGERMVQRNYAEAAKQDFYNKVDSTGVGKIVEAGEKVPDGMVGVPIQRRVLTIVKPGEPSVWKSLNQTLAVPKDMAAEVRQAFQTDSPIQNSAVKLFNHVMTKVQVAAGVDAFAHTMNDVSGVATAARSKLGQNIFPAGAVDTVSRLWKNGARVISDDAGIQREIADMAKNGVTFRSRDGGSPSASLLRFVDTVSRVSLNQIFEQGVKDGTFKDSADNRRTFINSQLGQYNPRLMGRVTQMLQESGVAPFIVAGKNFNRLGMKQAGLMTGVEATSIGEQAKVKLYKAGGLVSAGIAAPLLLNKYFTGSYTGTAGTKAGEIDFGKKDKQGNEIRYDMMKLLMLRRGMRVTGTEGLVEGQVMPRLRGEQPEPIGQSLKRGALDAAKGVAGPYVGPAANATSTLFTGKSVLGYDNRQPGEGFPYVKAAAKSANPLLGSGAEGYNKGSAKDAIAETFGKMVGLSYRNQSGVIRNLARTYTIQQGKGDDGSYAPSLYQPLVNAIKAGNPSTAQKQYDSLLQSKSQKEIETYFEKYANRPYTWSQQGDEAFQKTLTPQQQKLYQDTRDEDTSLAEKFFDTFSNKAFRAPKMRRPSRDAE